MTLLLHAFILSAAEESGQWETAHLPPTRAQFDHNRWSDVRFIDGLKKVKKKTNKKGLC